MKKIFLIFLILGIFNFTAIPAISSDKTVKKPMVSVFNRAIKNGDIEKVRAYINAGFDPNETYWGTSVILTAITERQNDMLDFLLKNGASPNPHKSQVQPLFHAVVKNNPYAVKKLLEAGADQTKTFMNVYPKELAIRKGYTEIVDIFYDYNNLPQSNVETIKLEQNIQPKEEIQTSKVVFSDYKKTIPTLKDPMLIDLPYSKSIADSIYNKKVKFDNQERQKQTKTLTEEDKKIYYIFEKIIRANNLQYQTWRICLNINPETINAYSGSVNLITINSSIYDSLSHNNDAIAFIISHELAHLLLEHNQISMENNYKIEQIQKQIQTYADQSKEQSNLATWNNISGNYYASIGNSATSIVDSLMIGNLNTQINNIYEQERQLEISADTEAITLMTRAGFDPNNAFETLSFLANVPNIYTNRSTHPNIDIRADNIKNEINLLDLSELKKQGRINIYNSKVLQVKKSSDKVTLVFPQVSDYYEQYTAETKETKYIRKAYSYYKIKDFYNACNYFLYAYQINPKNYITLLYITYCYENSYLQTYDKRYLKLAKKYIHKAKKINNYNSYILEEENSIKNLFNSLK